MGIIRKMVTSSVVVALLSGAASADLMRDLSRMTGYTIIHTGTVTGYINKDGEKENDFEGCEHGRKLLIDDSYVVTCNTYNYEYAFRPDIVILTKNSSAKAIIEDEVYDIIL